MCCELPDVRGRHVVLGVTGGIAVYKSCEIVSRLRKLGVETHVIMTKNAAQFVQPLTFETLSNHPVVTDTFARPETWEVEHIALAKRADVFAIAPATANIMAKMACGIADDMLSTTILATKAPILLAPAMNTGMWTAAVTQQNVQTLKARGVHFAGPEAGFLACGDTGAGRMSEPETIVRAIASLLCPKRDFAGLRVLVTAGATRERLDPVRYMTNDSSGKMGFALAEAARNRGAQVTVIAGRTTAPVPDGIDIRRVESTQDLFDAVTTTAPDMDVVIQAAAPADYRFAVTYPQKHKKAHDGQPFVVELVENPDIAAAVGAAKKPGQVLVGFAAETENLLQNARRKLESKHLDLIVLIRTLPRSSRRTARQSTRCGRKSSSLRISSTRCLTFASRKKHKKMDCSQMRSSPFPLHNRCRQNPLFHPHGCALTGRGCNAQVVHERLHDGKTHAAAFLFRVRGKKRFHRLRNVGDAASLVGDFNGQQRAVNACAQDNRAARALVTVHDGVRDSFGDGGLDVGNFADSRGELDGKGGNHDAREGFVFGQGKESDFHFVVMAHACAS